MKGHEIKCNENKNDHEHENINTHRIANNDYKMKKKMDDTIKSLLK